MSTRAILESLLQFGPSSKETLRADELNTAEKGPIPVVDLTANGASSAGTRQEVHFDFGNPFDLPELCSEDVDRLHSHVRALAGKHNLDWQERDIGWLEAEGALDEGWFESPLLRNEFAYLVAVHEIGHHVLGLPSDDEHGNVVFSNEVDVWQWALETVIIEPSERARAQIRSCLQTYEEQPAPPAEEVARLEGISPRGGNSKMAWRPNGSEVG